MSVCLLGMVHFETVIPFQCSAVEVLCFLQGLVKKCKAFSTIEMYLATTLTCHVGFGDKSVGQQPSVFHFYEGGTPQAACCQIFGHHLFEPLGATSLKLVSLKTVLLLAMNMVKHVSEF